MVISCSLHDRETPLKIEDNLLCCQHAISVHVAVASQYENSLLVSDLTARRASDRDRYLCLIV